MRFIIVHKTTPEWEAGATPTTELIQRVGKLIGDLNEAGVLRGGEGLRASSLGVRLRFAGGARTAIAGPLTGDNELPAGFSLISASTLDDAVDWATRQAAILGDVELDVRPLTESWDLGLMPEPDDATRRWMVLRKADAATEADTPPSAAQRDALARLQVPPAHLTTATMRSSKRGRRYKASVDGVAFTDGPFAESKELIAGYVIVDVDSIEEAGQITLRYIDVVGTHEVDVRELAD